MRKLIIASHGRLSEGFVSSLNLIVGKQNDIECICAYETDNNIEFEIKKVIEQNNNNDLIIITDLLGGSVNNYLLNYSRRNNVYLIAGANLALILEIVCNYQNCQKIDEMIKNAVEQAKKTIVYCDDNFINNLGDLSDF